MQPAIPFTTRRYANTWVNVRAHRSSTAPVVQVLRPGEMVLVDSPKERWNRVLVDSRALGYVDERFLRTSPAPVRP